MEKKFYLDTSIWRDYFEDRTDNLRPLGLFAFQFLSECVKRNFSIFYSELNLKELRKYYSEEKIMKMFEPFNKRLFKVELTKEVIFESKLLAIRIKDSHQSDIIHALLARNNKMILVACDKGFEFLHETVLVKKPEEIIFD